MFGAHWMMKKIDAASGASTLEGDLTRSPIIATQLQARQHVEAWTHCQSTEYYMQGDMFAGNLSFLLGHEPQVFQKVDEPIEVYYPQLANESFAFVNEKQEFCGISFVYRRDDPSKWLIAFAKNTVSNPKEKQIILLSSVDLNQYIVNPSKEAPVLRVDPLASSLQEQVQSKFVRALLEMALSNEQGTLNARIERITLLTRHLKLDGQADLLEDPVNIDEISLKNLFADNSALDRMVRYNIHVSAAMLMDCLSAIGGLRKELETLPLGPDRAANICLLTMTLFLYEQKLLDTHREFLRQQLFSKVSKDHVWNGMQLSLVPFMLQNQYSADLFQLVLSAPKYYQAAIALQELGLSQYVLKYFTNAEKLGELDFFSNKEELGGRAMVLCMLFWVKMTLSKEQYQQIIAAAERCPRMVDALIALDKSGEESITDLLTIALSPDLHLRHSIIHHFGKQIADDNLALLDDLTAEQLIVLHEAYALLQKKPKLGADLFNLALKEKGSLLPMFLAYLNHVEQKYHSDLIDLLAVGIKKGDVSFGEALLKITDQRLRELAEDLLVRFNCAHQIQALGFDNALTSLAANPLGIESRRFRHIILRVESECKRIHTLARGNELREWRSIEEEYRRSLYRIAFDALSTSSVDTQKLREKQNEVLSKIDPSTHSFIHNALVVLANLVVFALTAGIANIVRYTMTHKDARKTPWFFNHTPSGEALCDLESDYVTLLTKP
jgi:hypothetical protein